VHDQRGLPGQVIEDRRGLVEEERQVALHAGGRDAAGDVLVDAALGGIALEALAEILSRTTATCPEPIAV
jgi:hypothetical protein